MNVVLLFVLFPLLASLLFCVGWTVSKLKAKLRPGPAPFPLLGAPEFFSLGLAGFVQKYSAIYRQDWQFEVRWAVIT